MAQTGDKQKPRADVGLSRPFYFNDPAAAAVRAQTALEKSRAEVAELDRQLAERQAKIGATKDAAARQALELEQQRQQALQVAKKIEADNLAREAQRQAEAAVLAQQISLKKQADEAAARRQQNELGNLAAARRAELERLAQSGASDNPDILIETVERLEIVLAEVDGQYSAALKKSLASTNATRDKQLASLSGQVPAITETDAEFAARISGEKQTLEDMRQSELSKMRDEAEAQRMSQTAALRRQYDETLRTLQTKTWTLTGSAVDLTIGIFDRNAKAWPFTVDSKDPTLPMLPVNLVAKLGAAADPRKAILELDAAVKAKALVGEIEWGITRDTANERYVLEIRVLRVKSLTSASTWFKTSPINEPHILPSENAALRSRPVLEVWS